MPKSAVAKYATTAADGKIVKYSVFYHFAEVTNMIEIGKGG